MLYSLTSRRVVWAVLIVGVVYFTFFRLHSPSGFDLFDIKPEQRAVCHIFPEWEGSSAAHLVYGGVVANQPPVVGDAASIGDPGRCLSASSRLDQYQQSQDRNWRRVRWGEVQRCCFRAGRHSHVASESGNHDNIWFQMPEKLETKVTTDAKGRTAVVLRTWDDYNYTDTRLAWLRALITEISLHSGGAYEVFLLVNVKDDSISLGQNSNIYEQKLRDCVPREFRDMALLYNQKVLEAWYPKVKEHGAQDQMYQALQIFTHKFPQFSHVWQLEMDLRMTGHAHTTLESASTFARAQPRHNLWERNGRFYIPELYNGSYEAFAAAVDAEIGEVGIWGPVHTTDFEPKGPQPPPRSTRSWGVDEDADLISFMPMIDPRGTDWTYERHVVGFADGETTPRRAAFAQHEHGQWVVSEATLETFALLHGLKAVTVPHPIAFANDMTAQTAEADINRGPPHNKAGGHLPSFAYTTKGWVQEPWPKSSYWFATNDAANKWHSYLDGECMPPMLLHPVKDE
ncbi:hypothetical protein F4677DRAFT_462364 [Hypoxylon crocopeplum]|nr:hypothetical protein F4677DRAFT_462364 [Hypoxylon crocopeplum]